MPFQSEKQRRYLWANEPEIARDWTDTYGSGIQAAHGGRIPFAEAGSVGALTPEEISELETMIQTYPDTKVAEDAQKKLDINAGKSVEKEDIPWYEKMLGFSEAEGAETGNRAEDQVRQEFFDYGTQQADLGEYANLKVPGLNIQYPDAPVNLSQSVDLEANNYGQGIIKALPQQNKGNWLRNIANFLPFFGKDTKSGMALRALRSRFMPKGGIGDFAQTMRGGLTQRGYEQARQNRINMQRQSNIIKTLQSKNYAPGWETTAFKRVQDLGKDLNLVDAADVGLTRTRPAKKTVTPRHAPHHDRGNGGGNVTPSDLGMSTIGGGDPFFNRGGLAGLWQRKYKS